MDVTGMTRGEILIRERLRDAERALDQERHHRDVRENNIRFFEKEIAELKTDLIAVTYRENNQP